MGHRTDPGSLHEKSSYPFREHRWFYRELRFQQLSGWRFLLHPLARHGKARRQTVHPLQGSPHIPWWSFPVFPERTGSENGTRIPFADPPYPYRIPAITNINANNTTGGKTTETKPFQAEKPRISPTPMERTT